MHWIDACRESPESKAFRKTKDGRVVIRNFDGHGITERFDKRACNGDEFRTADDRELEGFLDWEPFNPQQKEER